MPAGVNGSFAFTVALSKGGSSTTTPSKTGTITATAYVAPSTYAITVSGSLNGTVTASPTTAAQGMTVTLTLSGIPAGYELKTISVSETGNSAAPSEPFTGMDTGTDNGATREFAMPNYDVTVEATFGKTQAQLDGEDVAAAQAAITGATYTVAQVIANTDVNVQTWLEGQISALLSGLNITGVATTVTLDAAITPATTGTAGLPAGVNGSFAFTVALSKGGSSATTPSKTGTVTATVYVPTTYTVTIAGAVNGTVAASQTSATAGTSITLTINPASGYELASISVTGPTSQSVALTGSGATRSFTMPAYNVNVSATFTRSQAQIDADNLAAARLAVAGATFTVAQATANTEASVRSWLATQINAILFSNGLRSAGVSQVSASDVSLGSGFRAATAGTSSNPAGANGSFSFTVTLYLRSNSTAASNTGRITATAYTPPPTYTIAIATTTNGTVTANAANAAAGTTITLTVTPAAGYELESVAAYRTGYTSTTVALNGTGLNRSFTMPTYGVTVAATFRKTQAQLDKEAVEAAKAAIEGGAYRIAQATGNNAVSVKTWLVNTLNLMFGQSHGLQLRSAATTTIVGDVAVTALTPAIAGAEANPSGTNGSFNFTVTLTRGATTLTTIATSGVIIATPHAGTPLKRIELLSFGDLTTLILNTGNVATGALTLALTGANADVFILPSATVGSLAVGDEAQVTLVPVAGLAIGVYKATLTADGEGLTPVSVVITYTVTPTGNDGVRAASLKAYAQNGTLNISGLTPGDSLRIYDMLGILVYQGIAADTTVKIPLPTRGIYLVTNGKTVLKIVN